MVDYFEFFSGSLRSPRFDLCGLVRQTLATTAEDAEDFAEYRRGNRKQATTVLPRNLMLSSSYSKS